MILSDIWLMKTNSDGDSLWLRTYGEMGNEYAYTVIQNTDGDYLIAGETHSATPNVWNALLICVEGIPTGIEPRANLQPLSQDLLDTFPNPFNSEVTIRFNVSKDSYINLTVTDLSGRLVENLTNGFKRANTYATTFDGSGLASGVYLCQIQAGNFSAVQKMLLVK